MCCKVCGKRFFVQKIFLKLKGDLFFFCSMGHARSWLQTKEKWIDIKSKATSKDDFNKNKTGNVAKKKTSAIEDRILDLLDRKKSNQLDGMEGGYDVCVSRQVHIVFTISKRMFDFSY